MLKIPIHKFNSVIPISSCLPLGKPHWLQIRSVWVLASLHGAPERVGATVVKKKKEKGPFYPCVCIKAEIYIYMSI